MENIVDSEKPGRIPSPVGRGAEPAPGLTGGWGRYEAGVFHYAPLPASPLRGKEKRGAFTLIEMAIVLTIIALVIGGIIVGKDLIRASELNSVISDVAHYTQAVIDFRDKYHALPGDFTGAEALWGSDTSCPHTPYTTTPHTATCNGNGDGLIDTFTSGTIISEYYRAWQQLADAGMIDGAYSGVAGDPVQFLASLPGINVPASKLSGGGYTIAYMHVAPPGNPGWWPMTGHYIEFGIGSSSNVTILPILTPAEAFSIDSKMDDGLPGYGNITASKFFGSNCTNRNVNPIASAYNTSYTGIACDLMFKMPF